jgi:hypothetical protein
MNESILTQLKILVERAVRPVRASSACKRKMREELLAHVMAVFEEEAGKLGDERAALERTAERFGNPGDLTGRLRDSLPAGERLAGLVEPLIFRPGESTLRRAVRHSLLVGAEIVVFLLLTWFVWGRVSEWPTEVMLHGSVLVVVCGLIFSFTFLAHWMRQALHGPAGRSWPRLLLAAAAAWLLIPAATFGMCLEFSGNVWSSLTDVLPMVAFFGAVPMLLAVVVSLTAAQTRSAEEWASLPVV